MRDISDDAVVGTDKKRNQSWGGLKSRTSEIFEEVASWCAFCVRARFHSARVGARHPRWSQSVGGGAPVIDMSVDDSDQEEPSSIDRKQIRGSERHSGGSRCCTPQTEIGVDIAESRAVSQC